MKRKDFIKKSSIGMTGLLLSNTLIGQGFSLSQIKDGTVFEVIIIGTGYGAAVTALRLAEAGINCLMLEMGMDWRVSNIPFSGMTLPEKQSTWLRNTSIAPFGNFVYFPKFTGVLDRIDFDNVKIYTGRGVGGGSLANGGMAVTPKRNYFEEIFPDLNPDDFYDTYFPLANEELGSSLIPESFYEESEYYQFSRIGELEAQNAGYETLRVPNIYDFDYMQEEEAGSVTKSALDGEVIYGNNHGKKDLTKTYLKKAIETGLVSILPLHKVEEISQNIDGTYLLYVSKINTSGETIESINFTTKKLFLGAGSIGTTKLLLKSKANGGLSNLSDETGKYWGNNGNVMTGRSFLNNNTGNQQSTIPASGIDAWEDSLGAFFAEIAPLPIGIPTWSALYLIINKVPYYGSFTYNTEEDRLELNWGTQQNSHMIENTKEFINKMNSANGGTISGLLFNNGIGADICYHPLGGCALGKATDMHGRVNNYPGLYVTDGALVPATIGVNPFVTITAIAEYCIENIISNDFDTLSTSLIENLSFDIKIYPIPFKKELNIRFYSKKNQLATIELYALTNKKIIQQSINIKQGEKTYTIKNLDNLSEGSYLIKIITNEKTYTKKITK